ncbi:MAG TPA: 4-hydroxy-3-methylbut-2-enyl diphosphate reductase [Tepidisphaeraceae bacterium]|jgi:4-hydroxy-3-methylbut-2-enyl diphosphate reductase
MKILLANPRGFCAGVNMAIECVEEVLKARGAPVYVYHEIVHNRHVVQGLQKKGVTFVDHIADVPPGSMLVYSAHGISPEIRRQAKARNLVEIDATCPLVTKVHMEVLRYAKRGYTIIFIGHRAHDEAVGTVGEAPDRIRVVESEQDVEQLDIPQDEKIAYVTQTTLSLYDAERIMKVLKKKFPNIINPPKEDICYATTNRQNAVMEISPEVDVVLVVGSQNSSNSRRLVETAQTAGRRAYLIDDASEVDFTWFNPNDTVLVTAGASAPDHLVHELIEQLIGRFGGDVETRTLIQEDIAFQLPKSVRRLAVVN